MDLIKFDGDTPPLARTEGRAIFGADASGYHAGRLGYPDALYDIVVRDAPDVLEIGSGTGLVTEALLARDVHRVVAVEPSVELVAYLRTRLPDQRLSFITGPFPNVVIAGRFDLAVCAAAFHWLDPVPALAKVRALLVPGGRWAMWWNSYRNHGIGDTLADRITPLLAGIALPPSDTLHRHYSLDVDRQVDGLAKNGFIDIEHHLFRRERVLTTAEVRALYASYSYVRLLPPTGRDELLDRITALVEDEFGGQALNVTLTALYICRSATGVTSAS